MRSAYEVLCTEHQLKNSSVHIEMEDLKRYEVVTLILEQTGANVDWSVCVQTMIEAHVDVKTTDGYLLRLFCVGFTKRRNNQIRKTSYAQHQQVRQIRKKMMEIMTREVQTNDLKEVVNKL